MISPTTPARSPFLAAAWRPVTLRSWRPPSNFRVSPFVGLLPPEAEMVLAPDEVEEIFTVPLKTLIANETFRKVYWRREGRDYEVPVFAIEGPVPRNIWGATAAMTAALLARLGWHEYRR